MGLSYAMTVAGKASTLRTLWPVADDKTAVFIGTFLNHMKQGQTASAALTATKREFNDQGLHPYYWAPFMLLGG